MAHNYDNAGTTISMKVLRRCFTLQTTRCVCVCVRASGLRTVVL